MIKYRTHWNEIKAIEVAGETTTQIITQQGRRERKRASWTNWHDTWEAAHAFLVGNAEKVVARLQKELENAQQKLEQIKAMKKDEV